MNRNQWEKELLSVKEAEIRFLKKQNFSGTDYLNKKIGKVIPFELEDKLEVAFRKSFSVIFELGNKKSSKTPIQKDLGFTESKETSAHIKANHTVISCAEGIGLGVLGIGLPDIPVFIGMMNRDLNQVAGSYGFSVTSERDKIFLLKIITAAFADVQQKKQENFNLGNMIINENYPTVSLEKAIEAAAKALAKEMLYLKFVQGIPLIGVLGGIFNPVCINKVSGYADLIYKKRYLHRIGKEQGFI